MGASGSRINATIPVTMTANEKRAEVERFVGDQVYRLYFINTGVTCDMLSSGLQRVGTYTDPELSRVGQNQSYVLGRVLRKFFHTNGVYYPVTCSSPFIAAQQTADYMLDPERIYIVPYIGSNDEYYGPAKQATILDDNANQPSVARKRDYLFFEDMSTPMYKPNANKFLEWFSKNSTTLEQTQLVNEPLEAARDNLQTLRRRLHTISSSNSAERRRTLLLENYDILNCEMQWAVYEILNYLRSLPSDAVHENIPPKNRFLYTCLHFIYAEIIETLFGIYNTFGGNTYRSGYTSTRRRNLAGVSGVRAAPSIRGYTVRQAAPVRVPYVPSEALNVTEELNAPREFAVGAGAGAGRRSNAFLTANAGSNSNNSARNLPLFGMQLRSPRRGQTGGNGADLFFTKLRSVAKKVLRSFNKYTLVSTEQLNAKVYLAKEFLELHKLLLQSLPRVHSRYILPLDVSETARLLGSKVVPIANIFENNQYRNELAPPLYEPAIDYDFELRGYETPSFAFTTHTAFLKELVKHPGIDHEERRRITFKPNSVHEFTLYLDRRTKAINFALYNGDVQYITDADKPAEGAPTRFLYDLGVHRSKDCAGEDICRKRTCGRRTARRSEGGGKTRRRIR